MAETCRSVWTRFARKLLRRFGYERRVWVVTSQYDPSIEAIFSTAAGAERFAERMRVLLGVDSYNARNVDVVEFILDRGIAEGAGWFDLPRDYRDKPL